MTYRMIILSPGIKIRNPSNQGCSDPRGPSSVRVFRTRAPLFPLRRQKSNRQEKQAIKGPYVTTTTRSIDGQLCPTMRVPSLMFVRCVGENSDGESIYGDMLLRTRMSSPFSVNSVRCGLLESKILLSLRNLAFSSICGLYYGPWRSAWRVGIPPSVTVFGGLLFRLA